MTDDPLNHTESMRESLAKEYVGETVKMYLTSGTILSGTLRRVAGHEALIHNQQQNRESFVNLAHVISISRL